MVLNMQKMLLLAILSWACCQSVYASTVLEAGSKDLKISLASEGIIKTASGTKFVLDILEKDSANHVIEIENITSSIVGLEIYRNKLIVFGKVDNFADGVTIIDLDKKSEDDFFICYRPQLLSNIGYIIFEKFYPRFSPQEVQSSVVLIYDLEKPAVDNRLEEQGLSRSAQTETHTASIENVGFPVYPEINTLKQNYSVWIENENERNRIISPGAYLWDDENSSVLFASYHHGENWLTKVRLSNELDQVEVMEDKIEINMLGNDRENSVSIKRLEFFMGSINIHTYKYGVISVERSRELLNDETPKVESKGIEQIENMTGIRENVSISESAKDNKDDEVNITPLLEPNSSEPIVKKNFSTEVIVAGLVLLLVSLVLVRGIYLLSRRKRN